MNCEFLFRDKEERVNVFAFECPCCGSFGEVGVPDSKMGIIFQHDCGTLFIERPAIGMFGQPSLVIVSAKEQA